MQTKEQFNAALKAKLDAAGFNETEQLLGALTSEGKAALTLLKALGPRGILPFMALSSVFARALAELSEALNVSTKRAVAASEMISEACMAHAETELSAMVGGVKLPLGGATGQQSGDCRDADCPVHGASAGGAPLGDLDFTRPTKPTDIN